MARRPCFIQIQPKRGKIFLANERTCCSVSANESGGLFEMLRRPTVGRSVRNREGPIVSECVKTVMSVGGLLV